MLRRLPGFRFEVPPPPLGDRLLPRILMWLCSSALRGGSRCTALCQSTTPAPVRCDLRRGRPAGVGC